MGGSSILGFWGSPSRARIGCRVSCRVFRRVFRRVFGRQKLEKCPVLTALWRRNPGPEGTVLAGNRPVLTALSDRNIGPNGTLFAARCSGCALAEICSLLGLLSPDDAGRMRDRGDQRPRAGRRRHSPRRPPCPARRWSLRRRLDLPDVRVAAPDRTAHQHQLAAREQFRPCSAVGPVRDARGGAHLLVGDPAHDAVRVRERGHRREEQARGAAPACAGQDRLEQLGIDLPLPPRPLRGEGQSDGARPSASRRSLLDDDQPAPDKLVAVVEVATAAQPGPRGGRRRARPRATVVARVAGQRERDQPLASRQVVARQRRGDRLTAHDRPPSRGQRRTRARTRIGSVPGRGRLRSELSPSG